MKTMKMSRVIDGLTRNLENASSKTSPGGTEVTRGESRKLEKWLEKIPEATVDVLETEAALMRYGALIGELKKSGFGEPNFQDRDAGFLWTMTLQNLPQQILPSPLDSAFSNVDAYVDGALRQPLSKKEALELKTKVAELRAVFERDVTKTQGWNVHRQRAQDLVQKLSNPNVFAQEAAALGAEIVQELRTLGT